MPSNSSSGRSSSSKSSSGKPTPGQPPRPLGRDGRPVSDPPPTRRSARQQRIANREAGRALARAGTRGTSGGSNQFLLYTAIAIVLAVVVIGAAFVLTQNKGTTANGALGSPMAPQASFITPTSVHADGRTLGDANAKATIDLWEDFQCTACYSFTQQIEPQIISGLVATGKAKLVFHDALVIDKNVGGTESADAANAALCANDQGKFWPYHDWLYANQYQEGSGAYTKDRLKALAAAMGGLDTAKFNTCVDGGTHDSDVATEQKNLPSGFSGTPTIVVNGTVLSSYDYSTIANKVLEVLGESPSPAPTATPKATATAAPTATPAPSASAVRS
jgi:protein-disulfide isomerase